MKAKLIYIIFLLGLGGVVNAQDDVDTGLVAKRPVIFRDKKADKAKSSIVTFDMKLKSNGWRAGINIIQSDKSNKKYRSFTEYRIGFGITKHPSEVLVSTGYATQQGIPGYVKFGKINSLYPIEFGMGKVREIGRRAVHDGVEIHWEYHAGLLLGWLLPYQISTLFGPITDYNANTSVYYKDMEQIVQGLGSFRNPTFKAIIPGGRVESNVVIVLFPKKRLVNTISLGASADFFTKPIPLFWTEDSGPFFVQLHAGFGIGKYKNQ